MGAEVQMPRVRRPAPVSVEPLVAYARRQRSEDGRWYWQAGYHEGGKLVSVPGLSGWATRPEMLQRLAARVSASDWRVFEDAPLAAETVDHLLRLWLAAQRDRRDVGDLAPTSYRAYLAHCRHLRPLLGGVLLDRLDVAAIERARDGMLRQGLAPRTVGLTLRLIRMAWSWGRDRGLVPQRHLPRVALKLEVGVYVNNHRTPTTGEVARAAAELSGWHRVAVELLWATGARVGEVLALTWADVSLSRRELSLRGKTGARVLPVSDALARHLVRPAGAQDDDRILLVSQDSGRTALRAAMEVACRRAEVEPFSPHGLRRLASTILIGSGVDARSYEAVMGHSYAMGLRTYAQAQTAPVRAAGALLGRQREAQEGQVVHGPWASPPAPGENDDG